jgi:hypothetical protein
LTGSWFVLYTQIREATRLNERLIALNQDGEPQMQGVNRCVVTVLFQLR